MDLSALHRNAVSNDLISWDRAKRPEQATSLEDFVRSHDHFVFSRHEDNPLDSNSHTPVVNDFESLEQFYAHLDSLNFMNPEKLRPGWDSYFMVGLIMGQVFRLINKCDPADSSTFSLPPFQLHEAASRCYPRTK